MAELINSAALLAELPPSAEHEALEHRPKLTSDPRRLSDSQFSRLNNRAPSPLANAADSAGRPRRVSLPERPPGQAESLASGRRSLEGASAEAEVEPENTPELLSGVIVPAPQTTPAPVVPVAQPRPAPQDLEALALVRMPIQASAPAFYSAQLVRHILPVGLSRMVAQGLVAPAVARLIETHPQAAAATQGGIAIFSGARMIGSLLHSESHREIADMAFSGLSDGTSGSTTRHVWQSTQRVGVLVGDLLSVTLTGASIKYPVLLPIAQALAMVQVRSPILSQGREFLRPLINTVGVGVAQDGVDWPAQGRNLRAQDVTPAMSGQYGFAVGLTELGSQMFMQLALGGKKPWQASLSQAVAAGAIAGVFNTMSSSAEDHIIDSAAARRMQQTDPAHVRHLQFESHNPLSYRELARQFERVDVRMFNQMLPAMLAAGVLYGLDLLLPDKTGQGSKDALTAGINAVVNAVILGCLLAATTRTYQVNDSVRSHNAANTEGF
jgi:hypothetical protein